MFMLFQGLKCYLRLDLTINFHNFNYDFVLIFRLEP